MTVTKFGGTSLADAAQIRKVFDIVKNDPDRRVVVVSAPGKRNKDDVKVTDMLIGAAAAHIDAKNRSKDATEADNTIKTDFANPATIPDALDLLADRFGKISSDLGLGDSFADAVRDDLRARLTLYDDGNVSEPAFYDLLKAAGEDNNAKLVAQYFRKEGVPASYVSPKEAGFLLSDEYGKASVLPETGANVANALKARLKDEVVIFPGFFGYTKSGAVITFSRGGSDITGSILAAALDADVYENYTDVSNVFAVNPSIVENPIALRELTYREMRELSYAGFNVYHEDALVPVFNKGIPVLIKNTNDPDAPGTAILPSRAPDPSLPVAGIAADKGFLSVNISKLLMNSEVGFGRAALSIIEDERLSFEHMPSGIDNISMILRESDVSPEAEARMIRRIKEELAADDVSVRHNLAIVMLVGEGMLHTVGTTARASRALASLGINIEIINQGASEVSLMFGLAQEDAEKAVRGLYDEFFADFSA